MLEVYILSGGEVFYQVMNAVAALFGSSSWAMVMRWALNIAVLGGMIRFIGTKDLAKLLRWVLIYIFIFGVLIVPKKSVQIIDLSDPLLVHKVDNIPLGIGILFSFSTRIGFGIAEIYDNFFSVPDAVAYSKTGFMFGANLARDSLFVNVNNSEFKGNFNNYINGCVVGDIMLNNKYSLKDLTESNNVLDLITSNPSPVRRMIYSSAGKTQNISCKEGANNLKNDTAGLFSKNGSIMGSLNRLNLSNSAAKELALRGILEESYAFFYKSSLSATEILKQNVSINAIRNGFSSFASKQGDVSSLVMVTSENSLLKSRLNWAVSSQIATTYLPLLHTVMLLMLFGLFPIILILTLSDVMGIKPLQLYALSLVYLMSWLPLYSILNYIMVFYTKSSLNGVIPNLSNIDKIKLIHSDISMLAGYLSLSIPFLALGLVKGFASVATNASNFLNASITGAASQSTSSAADGNWSLGNVSTENVQGFKWDTNYLHSSGMMSRQLSTGAMANQASDGTYGINTSSIMSHLATTGSLTKSASQQYIDAQRFTEQMIADARDGFNQNTRNLFNSLSQLQRSTSEGGNHSNGYSSDLAANINKVSNEALSIASKYAESHKVNLATAVNYLNFKTSEGHFAATLGGVIGASTGGVPGFKAGVELGGRIGASFTTGSTDNINDSSSEQFDNAHSEDAELQNQWHAKMETLVSLKQSISGNELDGYNRTLLDNLTGSYEKGLASSKTFSEGNTVLYNLNQEYNELTSGSSTITSNLNNEFVKWIKQNDPLRADEILSNTSDSSIARERESMWNTFMSQHASNRINTILSSAPNFRQQYMQRKGELKDSTGLEDAYNQMEGKVSTNRLNNNNEINEKTQYIKDKITNEKTSVNKGYNLIDGLIDNNKQETDNKVNDKTQAFNKFVQDARNINDKAHKNQRFINKNQLNDYLDDKKNNKNNK